MHNRRRPRPAHSWLLPQSFPLRRINHIYCDRSRYQAPTARAASLLLDPFREPRNTVFELALHEREPASKLLSGDYDSIRRPDNALRPIRTHYFCASPRASEGRLPHSLSTMAPPSSTQIKAMVAQFTSLTGESERVASRVGLNPRQLEQHSKRNSLLCSPCRLRMRLCGRWHGTASTGDAQFSHHPSQNGRESKGHTAPGTPFFTESPRRAIAVAAYLSRQRMDLLT